MTPCCWQSRYLFKFNSALGSYLENGWNIMDLLVPFCVLYVYFERLTLELGVYNHFKNNLVTQSLPPSINLLSISRRMELIQSLGGIALLLAWFKFLRYFRMYYFIGLNLRIIWAMVAELRGWSVIYGEYFIHSLVFFNFTSHVTMHPPHDTHHQAFF